MTRLARSMLRVVAIATAVFVFAQVAAASVHSHDADGTSDESTRHDTCAACVFAAAAPSTDAAPVCPAAPFVETFEPLELAAAPVIVTRYERPPARAPPAIDV